MLKDGLISVIIPVYNTAKYLPQCLDSICSQTYENLEIIVINDGSTDNSLDILLQYADRDSRIRIINQNNKGLSSARNNGLQKATGQYVLFLDSDDWIDQKTCESALKIQQAEDADIVLWSYVREYIGVSKPVLLFDDGLHIWANSKVKELYQRLVGLRGKQLRQPQKIDSLVTAWGKLYRREIIGDVQFVDTKIIGTEDALFNIQVFSKVQKAVYLPQTYSHYRKSNNTSLTRKYKKELAFQWKELYKLIEEHLKKINAAPELYDALNNRICLGLIGLGLNLAKDDRMTIFEKNKELRLILHMPHYKKALNTLRIKDFTLPWKFFFLSAKYSWTLFMYIMLNVMNKLRGC